MTKLNAIKSRAEKATEGPWVNETVPTSIGHCHKIMPIVACLYVDHRHQLEKDAKTLLAKGNADFIAHARADIPALLRVVEAAMRISRSRTRKIDGASIVYAGEMVILNEALAELNQPTTADKPETEAT